MAITNEPHVFCNMPTTLGKHLCLKYDFDIGVSVYINTIINFEVLA